MNNMETAQLLASLVDEKRGELRDIEVMACMDYIVNGIHQDMNDRDEEELRREEDLRAIEYYTELLEGMTIRGGVGLRCIRDDPVNNLREFDKYVYFTDLCRVLERSQSQ